MTRQIQAWTTDTGTWRFFANGDAAFEATDGRGVSLPRIACRVVVGDADDPGPGCAIGTSSDEGRTEAADDRVETCCRDESHGFELTRVFRRTEDAVSLFARMHVFGSSSVRTLVWPMAEAESRDPSWFATLPFGTGYRLSPGALHQGEEIVLNYPVHASMAWTSLCAGPSSVYLGIHDPEPWLKRLHFGRRGRRLLVDVSWPDLDLQPGTVWESPEIVLAPNTGGWREGAARYRSWMSARARWARPPDWFFRHPVWAWVGMKGQHAEKPDRRYEDLPSVAADLRGRRIPVPQVAGWLEHGHDTHYPDYVAGASLGGREGLRSAVRAVHDAGGRLALYTNGRLIDPQGSAGWRDGWQKMCVRLAPCAQRDVLRISGTFCDPAGWDADGALAKEEYDRVTFAIGCPGSASWRDLLVDRLADAAASFHVDGLYVDQVSGCSSLPCYAPGHDHERPGLAWRSYLTLLAALRLRVRAARPEAYLATEGVADVFGQSFDAQQAHNDWRHQVLGKAEEMPELFRTTFPELLVMMGPIPPGEDRYVRWGHVLGAGLDCFLPDPGQGNDRFFALLERYAAHRLESLPWIAAGRPAADLATDAEGVRVFGFRTDAGFCIHGARMEGKGPVRLFLPGGHFDARAAATDEDGKTERLWVEPSHGRPSLVIRRPGLFRVVVTQRSSRDGDPGSSANPTLHAT